MRYSIINGIVGALLCIFLLNTFSHADYLDDLKASWKKNVAKIQVFTKKTKEFFGDVVKMGVLDKVKFLMQEKLRASKENFYSKLQVSVRQGNTIHQGEREFVHVRKMKVTQALEKMFNVSLENKTIPTIAIIASGGGYRSMLGTTGFLCALEKIGVLDATMYVSTLSGSTWAVAPWITMGISLDKFKLYLRQVITKNFFKVNPQEAQMIASAVGTKLGFDESITLVDLYGALLANSLLSYFEDRRQVVRISDQVERIKPGDYPYPIYTAIDARSLTAPDPAWFEFTPYEIGSPTFGTYIPMWSYGRQFNAGKSINFAPEQSLGFNLGTFGSAFGFHLGLAWNTVTDQLPESPLKTLIINKIIDPHQGKRMFWAEVYNFMFGMEGQDLSDRKYLKLVDAGISFNLPYPPVSGERPERKVDILIFCDMSADQLKEQLQKCEEYAKNRSLAFPKINYEGIDQKVISIFKDEADANVPIVIYMPRVSDPRLWKKNKFNKDFKDYNLQDFDIETCVKKEFCGTANLRYTFEQSKQIMDQMEFNVLLSKEQIINEIRWMIEQKNQEERYQGEE